MAEILILLRYELSVHTLKVRVGSNDVLVPHICISAATGQDGLNTLWRRNIQP